MAVTRGGKIEVKKSFGIWRYREYLRGQPKGTYDQIREAFLLWASVERAYILSVCIIAVKHLRVFRESSGSKWYTQLRGRVMCGGLRIRLQPNTYPNLSLALMSST
eukprot:1380803-Amorphochlora_amoeboformis.AAC.2